MSDLDAIRREREAVARLEHCLDIIASDLDWYWHWGDSRGGWVLDKLAALVREKGHRWPTDETVTRIKKKAKISGRLSKAVFERDQYRCVECQTHIDLCCDHIIPESKGGPTTLDNLQTMCRPCNSRKGVSIIA